MTASGKGEVTCPVRRRALGNPPETPLMVSSIRLGSIANSHHVIGEPLMSEEAMSPIRVGTDERKAALDRVLMTKGAEGWRTESRGEFQATLAKGKPVNHVLHVILAVLSLGLWLPVWLLVVILGGLKRRMVMVDDFGNVQEQGV